MPPRAPPDCQRYFFAGGDKRHPGAALPGPAGGGRRDPSNPCPENPEPPVYRRGRAGAAMMPEVGTLACTAAGGLVIGVEAEAYRIAPEDVRSLIFAGRPAPVALSRVRHDRCGARGGARRCGADRGLPHRAGVPRTPPGRLRERGAPPLPDRPRKRRCRD
ncbi:protein of unknown function [Methanoculleus bourgensis]|uniref:Uncharacterized protein n=1 Tax=Methanoculleus bourgensis TaxID=83986 RepID=A0A0X8XY89_9EURY|nr:protein of unknown function [Methanoculleus bourgensis]